LFELLIYLFYKKLLIEIHCHYITIQFIQVHFSNSVYTAV